jgi:hypothetical protein
MNEGDRVRIRPLDGIGGTVIRLPDEDHVTVLADCATQPVRWRRDEVTPEDAP